MLIIMVSSNIRKQARATLATMMASLTPVTYSGSSDCMNSLSGTDGSSDGGVPGSGPSRAGGVSPEGIAVTVLGAFSRLVFSCQKTANLTQSG